MANEVTPKRASSSQPAVGARRSWWRARPEAWWWIAGVVVVPVLVMTALAIVVLVLTTHPATAGERIDVVKTALSVGAGSGGVVALVLAGRRQWSTEQAHRLSERSSAASEHDATQRRITDLYGKAVDQLGSDKAPVRLGGLYALERLAQDTPELRETVVDVLCAYLRMPYTPPPDTPPAPPSRGVHPARKGRPNHLVPAVRTGSDEHRQALLERDVRLTAQRLLARHLRPDPGDDGKPTNPRYWTTLAGEPIGLDLTGATLIDFDLVGCHLAKSTFRRAAFVERADFRRVTFTSGASFGRATFTGNALFGGVTFAGEALFGGVTFSRDALFDGAAFTGNARFGGVTFAGNAWFGGVTFTGDAWFDDVAFTGDAWFGEATFRQRSNFAGATVSGDLALFGVADDVALAIRLQLHLAPSAEAGSEESEGNSA